MSEARFLEAEQCCRALLAQGLAGVIDSEVRRRLIEALTGQQNWTSALDEVRYWRKYGPTAPRLYVNAVLDVILNAGLSCVLAVLISEPDALHVLDELLTWPDVDEVLATATTIERSRVDLLHAISDRGRSRTIPPQEMEHLAVSDIGEAEQTGQGWVLVKRLVLGT